MNNNPNTYCLVLGGGGGRGAYEIGVWRALRELGIGFHAVAGTSVGALNAVFRSPERLRRSPGVILLCYHPRRGRYS
ncbi:patatin-like phospholipase family protein [Marispirochaeta sp.]|uniref:patatin-like phospholipase family protein n=1 Tax=Marispirochaeta sp. TaxID=2038653 RepID=UPI0029C6295D|nr:patatin-like phospholipase family protein [Marispirochaeta sp.]